MTTITTYKTCSDYSSYRLLWSRCHQPVLRTGYLLTRPLTKNLTVTKSHRKLNFILLVVKFNFYRCRRWYVHRLPRCWYYWAYEPWLCQLCIYNSSIGSYSVPCVSFTTFVGYLDINVYLTLNLRFPDDILSFLLTIKLCKWYFLSLFSR